VAGEEIDISGSVRSEVFVAAPMAAEAVCLVAIVGGGFHLHAPDVRAGVDPDIIGFVVAEGLSDRESAAGSLEHEVQFGQIAYVF